MAGAYLHSFLIAKALGLYMIILSIVFILRADYYKNIMENVDNERLAVLSGSSLSLVLGLILISIHNFWAFEAYVIVTILGWLIVIKSVLWLALPIRMAQASHAVFSGKSYYVVSGIIAIIGIWLLSYGVFIYGNPQPFTLNILS